jgi:hypothetical protein
VVLRKYLHRFAFDLALLAVVVLAVTQLGATAHAYSHDATGSTRHQSAPAGHNPCDDCLAYAPLLSAVAAPPPLPPIEPQNNGTEIPQVATSLVDISPSLAFRSRAPPFVATQDL